MHQHTQRAKIRVEISFNRWYIWNSPKLRIKLFVRLSSKIMSLIQKNQTWNFACLLLMKLHQLRCLKQCINSYFNISTTFWYFLGFFHYFKCRLMIKDIWSKPRKKKRIAGAFFGFSVWINTSSSIGCMRSVINRVFGLITGNASLVRLVEHMPRIHPH